MLIENITKDYKNYFISIDIYPSLTHVTVSNYESDDYIYNVKHVFSSVDEILQTVYQLIDDTNYKQKLRLKREAEWKNILNYKAQGNSK